MAFNKKLEELKSDLIQQARSWNLPGSELSLAAAEVSGFPGPKSEEWKYSPLPIKADQPFVLKGNGNSVAVDLPAFPIGGVCQLVFVDGRFEASLSDPLPEGIKLEHNYTPLLAGFENLLLSHMNDATAKALCVQIEVEKEAEIKPLLVFRYGQSQSETASWIQPRLALTIGKGAKVSFMEYAEPDAQQVMLNSVSEIEVQDEAEVYWLNLEEVPVSRVVVNQTRVSVAEKARFEHVAISMGEGYVRNNLEIQITGEEGDAHMYGLSLGSQKFHVDHHTFVNHKPENTTSNQLYKGIFAGRSKGVFNGKILVDQPAQKTNAYQSSKNILIGSDAGVFAKPQLEIFADDVKCSHGATIGQLDEEPIFYLRSRGLDLNTARMLLIQAFASEVLFKIQHPDLRNWVEEKVLVRMDKMLAESKNQD
jgi:Fe-S cluster assembly protein SufD